MKKLSELLLGEKAVSFAVLYRKEKKQKKNGELFLSMELGDAFTRLAAVMWEQIETAEEAKVGEVVKFAGMVDEYQSRKQIRIEKIRSAREDDPFDLNLLIPSSKVDRATLWQQYEKMIESIAQPFLLSLLHRIFDDEEFAKSFRDSTASKGWHHGYLGGLLEHSLSVAKVCDQVASFYPQIDRDLLVTAAMLHDIGKVQTYKQGPVFEYTDEGRLLGHIAMGYQLIAEKIAQFPQFPKELSTRLLHLILSHQGFLEHASPVVPMIPEGFILYYIDEIDSKLNSIEKITQEQGADGTRWSSFNTLLERSLYLGDQKSSTET